MQEVEKSTSGEIVPLVRSASYHYPTAALLGALLVSVVLAAAATAADAVFKPWGSLSLFDLWVFPAVFAVCFLIVHQLLRLVPSVKRLFISQAEMTEEVDEAAITAFYRHRLAETRDRTGILLFVSVFERRAMVLADKGINAKVAPETWQQVVDLVLRGIREGRKAEGLCEAVSLLRPAGGGAVSGAGGGPGRAAQPDRGRLTCRCCGPQHAIALRSV